MWPKVFMSILSLCTYAVPAGAVTLTECGASDGYAYYFAGGPVPREQAGMRQDGVSGGAIVLNHNGVEFDILVRNALRNFESVKSDGKMVQFPSRTEFGLFHIMVVYDRAVENYIFQLDDRGDGVVAWSSIRANAPFNKVALYSAACRGSR